MHTTNDENRPPVRRKSRRAIEFRFLIDDGERALLRERASAAGITMAAYVRRAALGRQAGGRDVDASRIIRALSPIGSDLNKIARLLNSGSRPDEAIRAEITDALGALRTVLRECV